MPFTEDQLRDIADDAARSVYPPERIGDVTASIGVSFNGEEAYHFAVYLDQVEDRDDATNMRMALRRAIREHLFAAGDETYPYVRILSRAAVA